MPEASAYDLWRQAGGGTDRYDRQRYRDLMIEHGLLIPLEPGETADPLPCGWRSDQSSDSTIEQKIRDAAIEASKASY